MHSGEDPVQQRAALRAFRVQMCLAAMHFFIQVNHEDSKKVLFGGVVTFTDTKNINMNQGSNVLERILWEEAERELDASEKRVTYQFISQKMPPFPTGQKASAANECSGEQ